MIMESRSPMEPPPDEAKEEKECEENISDILLDFADVTTAHGYGHLISTKSIILKIFWIISILICHIFIIMHIYHLVEKYFDKPVVTSVHTDVKNHLTFPVVVLCNENMVRSNEVGNAFKRLSEIFAKRGRAVPEYLMRAHFNILASEMKEDIHKFGHKFENMVRECRLFGEKNCKHFRYWERYWHGRYGSCYVFNAGTYRNGTKKDVWKVFDVGPENSLAIDVDIEQPYYYANLTYSAGVRLYIGHQDVFYEPLTQGHSFGPGFEYSAGMRAYKLTKTDRFNNGSCIKHRPMKFYHYGQLIMTKYDQKMCTQLCKSENIITRCKCIEYHAPVLNITKNMCERKDIECIHHARKDIPKSCLEKCQPKCTERKYDVQISSLMYPSNVQRHRYKENLTTVRQNMLRLIIYFKEMEVEVWEDKLYYNSENLFSDIGGQLGLFSGYSVLTVLEFCVLIGIITKFYMKTGYKKQKKISALKIAPNS